MQFITKDSGARESVGGGMVRDTEAGKLDWTLLLDGPLLERWVALLDRGKQKYGARNWCLVLGVTNPAERTAATERFRSSAMRHFMQWVMGDRSEDHAAAVIFNMNGLEAMLKETRE